jgi:hypothetical protein
VQGLNMLGMGVLSLGMLRLGVWRLLAYRLGLLKLCVFRLKVLRLGALRLGMMRQRVLRGEGVLHLRFGAELTRLQVQRRRVHLRLCYIVLLCRCPRERLRLFRRVRLQRRRVQLCLR